MKIKSNEELFNRWLQLEGQVACGKSLVQNDIEIDRDHLAEWAEDQFKLIGQYKSLVKETVNYVLAGEEGGCNVSDE